MLNSSLFITFLYFRESKPATIHLNAVNASIHVHHNNHNLLFCRDGQDLQRGGCLRDFRNRPNPVRLKLRYYENVLTVSAVTVIVSTDQLWYN